MPGYLDQYGAGEEERNRIIIRSIIAVVVAVIVVSLGWYLLKNHHQEGVVKNFLADVRRGDLRAAYRDWGCTAQKPCSGYSFEKFSGDWGSAAKDAAPDPAVLGITDSESCNNGVLLTVAVNPGRVEKLWVDKGKDGAVSDEINFAPYPICPHKNPFAIMIHRTVGRLRKPLLK
ncbi:MAG TPA: hypothetical protein VG297_20380 [Bryobacteraceae bacterium]|jgi:hypothetical protein|nr:hypothetical protein [Bryobacteraceae bacterium]